MSKLFKGESWSIEDIEQLWKEIDIIGKELKLDYPPTQIEIISYDHMIENYVTLGLPNLYPYWSLGKDAIDIKKMYEQGRHGLALELIINTNPTIMYIMENNTLIEQALVLAHAGVGHGTVFKNNYLFKQWTDPDNVLAYFKFAQEYIRNQELKRARGVYENTLWACRVLSPYGVSFKKRKSKNHYKRQLESLVEERLNLLAKGVNSSASYIRHLQLKIKTLETIIDKGKEIIELPEENILYFLEKHSKELFSWQREIIRIHRKVEEHFYPQSRTKILHEGFASFIQMRIFKKLYKKGIIEEGGFLEFLRKHTQVIYQPNYKESMNLNPYAIGYYIFDDLYRMSKNPTKEDLKEYPEICNTDWKESLMNIVKNYKDSDFIARYLTPNVIKRFKLFVVHADDLESDKVFFIDAVASHIDIIRQSFVDQLETISDHPTLEIESITNKGLTVKVTTKRGYRIDLSSLGYVRKALKILWGNQDIHFIHAKTGSILNVPEV